MQQCPEITKSIPSNNILVFPTELVAQPSNCAVLSARFQSQDAEGLWNNHSLLLVVWWWDTLEDLETLHSSSTPGSLVWNHASNSLVEDLAWGTEVEWTTASWVVSGLLSEVGGILDYFTRVVSDFVGKNRCATSS